MCRLDESLWWDENEADIDTNSNDPALLALSTMELNVGDDFLAKLKGGIPRVASSLMIITYDGRDSKLRNHPTGCSGITIVV